MILFAVLAGALCAHDVWGAANGGAWGMSAPVCAVMAGYWFVLAVFCSAKAVKE